jgi:hypothetical protein
VREVAVDAFGGQAPGAGRQPRQQPADGRREAHSVRPHRVDEGLEAQPVAREHELAAGEIDDREREHPAQVGEAAGAPVLVRVQDEFGVRAGAKRIAGRSKRVRRLRPVVDLAVVGDPHVAAGVAHRLVGLGARIDDRQSGVDEAQRRRSFRRRAIRVEQHRMLGVRAAAT